MGDGISDIAQRDDASQEVEEVRRLLVALQAAQRVLAAAPPDPVELYLISEELRTTRRRCEATLRDLQEQLDLRVDNLAADAGPRSTRDTGVVARTVRIRSVAS